MFTIEFLKANEINGVSYKKGDTAKVSRSIRDSKVASGVAKEVTGKKINNDT